MSEQEKESLYLDIRQSFAVAMRYELAHNAYSKDRLSFDGIMGIVNSVLITVDDAVQNNLF
jgi:hypothetical protein